MAWFCVPRKIVECIECVLGKGYSVSLAELAFWQPKYTRACGVFEVLRFGLQSLGEAEPIECMEADGDVCDLVIFFCGIEESCQFVFGEPFEVRATWTGWAAYECAWVAVDVAVSVSPLVKANEWGEVAVDAAF